MHLLALHKIARSGDRLSPELLRYLSLREAPTDDTRIVALRNLSPAIPEIAGADPERPARR